MSMLKTLGIQDFFNSEVYIFKNSSGNYTTSKYSFSFSDYKN
jgi:hypothetical protein